MTSRSKSSARVWRESAPGACAANQANSVAVRKKTFMARNIAGVVAETTVNRKRRDEWWMRATFPLTRMHGREKLAA